MKSNKAIKQPTLIDGMDNPQKTVQEQPQPSVVDKTFTVERQVVHTEKVEVKFNELSYEDIRYMNRASLLDVINILLFGGKKVPSPAEEIPENPVVMNAPSLGNKVGKTSKYHYVFLNKASNKWVWQVGVGSGTHRYEIDAALAVDAYLDKIEDKNRPRNRDEFKEVSDALTNRVRVG